MWKYVTRRIRDTFERSANHLDKCSYAVVNPSNNISDDKNKKSPCCWFVPKKCWNSFQSENDTNSNRWKFEQLNRTWIGALTWVIFCQFIFRRDELPQLLYLNNNRCNILVC